MPSTRAFPLLLLCFFLSGTLALAYETAWTREFAFVFGTSELAMALVLAAYMGGLAIGAACAARWIGAIRRPVLVYGLLELGIALSALAVPHAIAGAQGLYVLAFGGRESLGAAGSGLATPAFYAGASLLVLLVPTSLMGATLPILARHAVREEREIGSRIGLLYGVNTAGAVVGAIATAFWLLPALGLRSTIQLAAGLNAVVFLLAWALSRAVDAAPAGATSTARPRPTNRGHWILPASLLSGAISFGYEIVWVRLLAHLLGSGIQAFATMLGAFLTGIALGAALGSRWATSPERAAIGFAAAQLGAGVLSWLAFQAVDLLPAWTPWLVQQGLAPTTIHVLASMGTLLPAAVCIGSTFPFAVRILAVDAGEAARASARVYAWNTVGTIVGSIGTAFFLLPELGFEGALAACVAANLLLAAVAMSLAPKPRWRLVALPAGLLLLLVARPPAPPWNMLTASSLGPARDTARGEVEYLGVGRSASVLLRDMHLFWQLRTNGLNEASMAKRHAWPNAFPLTRWLTALPALARPDLERMLVVGLGGATALEILPPSVRRVDVVELEPEVVEANRRIADRRWRDPLSDPRVHVHLGDARNALLLMAPGRGRYDAIVSQPSHPWAGGAAHLYTQEFFELAASRLEDDGVFLQWIGTGFVDEALLASLLAALANVFDHVEVYQPPPGSSLLFLCSDAPLDLERSARRALRGAPETFHWLGLREPGEVISMLRLDEDGVRTWARGARPNRDGFNRLQTRSADLGEEALARRPELLDEHDPLPGILAGREDAGFILRQLVPFRTRRLERLAPSLESPRDRSLAHALLDVAAGRPRSAEKRLAAILETAPRDEEARAALLSLSLADIVRGRDPTRLVPGPLGDAEALLVEAWRTHHGAVSPSASSAWSAGLDEALAGIDPTHPLAPEALRLRILWRLEDGRLERLHEAEPLVRASLGPHADAPSLLLRARLYAALDRPATALDAVRHLGRRLLASDPRSRAYVQEARRILRRIPEHPDRAPLRAAAEEAIRVRLP